VLYDVKSHALDQLQVIRDTMERAASFTAVPGWGGAAMGVTAIVAGAIAPPEPSRRWMTVWLADAAIAAAIGVAATVHKARRTRTSLSGAPARRFALAFAPALVAAVVFTAVIARDGRLAWLAGCWLLLYGAAVTSGGALSAKPVPLMGAAFMALGIAAFAAPGAGPMLMIVGFGLAQVAFGIWIGVSYGG
jgi:hypothetical protein